MAADLKASTTSTEAMARLRAGAAGLFSTVILCSRAHTDGRLPSVQCRVTGKCARLSKSLKIGSL
jgi:hypothetical protein